MPIWKGSVKRKSKALITGIGGFAGSYLTEYLLSKNFEIFGILAPNEGIFNLRSVESRISLEQFDIADPSSLCKFTRQVLPDYIFHLAAMASVGRSIQLERETYHINFFGSLNILEAARLLKKDLKKIVLVSSADGYGKFKPSGKLLKETQPFAPVSPYGISKVMMEHLAGYYFAQHDVPAVIARSFNHTGPRQSDNFVVPSFCRQIAEIESGQKEPVIAVGDLSAKRDLSDVRDIVRGYYLLAAKGRAGEAYHFSSGAAVNIKAVLDRLLSFSDKKIKVKVDKKRLRKSDIPVLRGDYGKARKQLGWNPQYKLEQTLLDTLQYWRDRTENSY